MGICLLWVEGLSGKAAEKASQVLSELVRSLSSPSSSGPDEKGAPSIMLTGPAAIELLGQFEGTSESASDVELTQDELRILARGVEARLRGSETACLAHLDFNVRYGVMDSSSSEEGGRNDGSSVTSSGRDNAGLSEQGLEDVSKGKNTRLKRSRWMSYEEAKDFVQGLGLSSMSEYFAWARSEIFETAEGRPLPSRPEKIPVNPQLTYAMEFEGFPVFIAGLRKSRAMYRSFEGAREFARSLGLHTARQWNNYADGVLTNFEGKELPPLPDDVPRWPLATYSNEFDGMGDWLGTGRVGKGGRGCEYLPYKEAHAFALSLGLRSQQEWVDYIRGKLTDIGGRRLPEPLEGLPQEVQKVYRDNFIDFVQWLGITSERLAQKKLDGRKSILGERYMSFADARECSRSLGVSCGKDWKNWRRGLLTKTSDDRTLKPVPPNLPSDPASVYEEWAGWPDFLGEHYVGFGGWRPYEEARAYARSLCFKSSFEWAQWSAGHAVPGRPELEKRPADIPSAPKIAYKNEFTSWSDFLGEHYVGFGRWRSDEEARENPSRWRPYEEARAYAHSLSFRTSAEWGLWSAGHAVPGRPELEKKPTDIPSNPNITYSNEFTSWADFLGEHYFAFGLWRSFEDARAYARSLSLSSAEWGLWAAGHAIPGRPDLEKKPADIPSSPNKTYRDEFISWPDFLRENGSRWRPYEEARAYAHSLCFKSSAEWGLWSAGRAVPGRPDLEKKPADIPSAPKTTYKNEFTSWPDFLGFAKNTDEIVEARPWKDARTFARSLGLSHEWEWKAWVAGSLKSDFGVYPTRPVDIPANPRKAYNREWAGWSNFLQASLSSSDSGENSYRPAAEARKLALSLGLSNEDEYRDWAKGKLTKKLGRDLPIRTSDIPVKPDVEYGREFISWSDWLGYAGASGTRWLAFEDARTFARKMKSDYGIRDQKLWERWATGNMHSHKGRPLPLIPDAVPKNPERAYRGDFKDWDDWLGNG